MIRTVLALIVSSACCSSIASAQKTGSAVANGNCNIAISGSNNTISSASLAGPCSGGISKEQGDKIVRLLNTILLKKDSAEINAKLDELITLASRPVQTQTCIGSACAQGPGAQATFNQYGAAKYAMTDDQRDIISNGMKAFAGRNVSILCVGPDRDTCEYGTKLSDALRADHLNVTLTSALMSDSQSGISVICGDDTLNMANSLAISMKTAGLIQGKLPLRIGSQGDFTISISPQR